MAIKLKNAILHSLSSVDGATVLSDTELDKTARLALTLSAST
jgi:hypothetical protein